MYGPQYQKDSWNLIESVKWFISLKNDFQHGSKVFRPENLARVCKELWEEASNFIDFMIRFVSSQNESPSGRTNVKRYNL